MKQRTVTRILCAMTGVFLLGCGGYCMGRRSQRGVTVRTGSGVSPQTAAVSEAPLGERSTGSGEARLDLNSATAEELQGLPGIGPVLADRILRYREIHGPFQGLEDLLQVEGIGKKTLEKIKEYVIVR